MTALRTLCVLALATTLSAGARAQQAGDPLMKASDAVLLLLDHQTGLFHTVKDIPVDDLRRNTVVLAYQYLETEGYITGRGSAGSFVAALDREQTKPRIRRARPIDSTLDRLTRNAVELARVAAGAHRVRAAQVPFRAGEPALDLFPSRLWARLYARRARRRRWARCP